MPGPRPTATHLKVLRGTRRDRLNGSEPDQAGGRPEAPERFDGPTRAEWGRLCDQLESLGVLAPGHRFALALYCGAFYRLAKAEEAIEKHGMFVESRGAIKANPAAAVSAACESLMLRILTEFGLTAASLSKVKASAEAPADEFEQFQMQRGA